MKKNRKRINVNADIRVKCSFCEIMLKPKFAGNHEAMCPKNPNREGSTPSV